LVSYQRKDIGATVLENSVLGHIFVSERKEVTGEWIQLHVWELRNIYPMPDVIRASVQGGWDVQGMLYLDYGEV
jgi:hypothetical protein